MSCTESYTGMIKEINLPRELIKVEEIIKFISLSFKIPEDKFEIDGNNKITGIHSEKVILNIEDGKWYEVLEKKCNNLAWKVDLFIAKCNNGIINFNVRYYNCEFSFNEAIITSLRVMKFNEIVNDAVGYAIIEAIWIDELINKSL